MKSRLAVAVSLLAIVWSSAVVRTQQPDRSAYVRIDASQCGAPSRRGSGFVWGDVASVVTSLHVVAGCSAIGVRYPVNGGELRDAQVTRISSKYDLALLTVKNPVRTTPLALATGIPAPTATITVWGYPLLVRGLLDTQFHRRSTAGTLDDLLNPDIRKQVKDAGMPDVTIDVLLLDGGHLLPGHSGAPIVDDGGRVVAVADGGLERGATEVSWAIPATHVVELRNAPANAVVPNATVVAQLFSAELADTKDMQTFESGTAKTAGAVQPAPTRPSVVCGGGTLVKSRNRSLAELAPSADDQRGLQQLIASASQLVQGTDRFDVYQELKTGATLVIPEGATISTAAGMCDVRSPETGIRQLVTITAASTPIDIQTASVKYELDLTTRLGAGWQIDPAWSYFTPLVRFDGLTARRKGNQQYTSTAFGPYISAYAFETLVAKQGLFMGVTAVRSGITPQMVQQAQMCMSLPFATGCDAARRSLRAWGLATIATHLSTFPVG